MFAHNMKRTPDEQNALFVKGVSKARNIQSPHVHGCAVDIVHGVRGWDLTRIEWDIVGHLGYEVARALGIKIQWGGEWSFYDPAHWELEDWRDVGPLK